MPNPTPSDLDDVVDESSTASPTIQLISDAMQPMASNAPLSSPSQGDARLCLRMCQIYHIVYGRFASRYVVSTLDSQFHRAHITFAGTRTLRNAFGHANEKVEQYRTNLVRLRVNFLARASVITEVAVLESGE